MPAAVRVAAVGTSGVQWQPVAAAAVQAGQPLEEVHLAAARTVLVGPWASGEKGQQTGGDLEAGSAGAVLECFDACCL